LNTIELSPSKMLNVTSVFWTVVHEKVYQNISYAVAGHRKRFILSLNESKYPFTGCVILSTKSCLKSIYRFLRTWTWIHAKHLHYGISLFFRFETINKSNFSF